MTQNNPEIALEVAQGMSEHFDDLLYRVKSNKTSEFQEKIIFALLYFCQKFGTGSDIFKLHDIGLHLTQQVL